MLSAAAGFAVVRVTSSSYISSTPKTWPYGTARPQKTDFVYLYQPCAVLQMGYALPNFGSAEIYGSGDDGQ